MTREHLYREAEFEGFRAVEGEDRTYEFVVATEGKVHVGYGVPEVLRMRGADLSRLKKNCPVLDTHDRGIRSILGQGKVRVDGRRMVATIVLDDTPEGEAARLRIESGSLRTASIGYRVDWTKTKELREGESDGKGDGAVEGPALVQNRWQPFELTLCPVPADEAAVRLRTFTENNRGRSRRSVDMAKQNVPAGRLNYSDLPIGEGEPEHDQGEQEAETRSGPASAPPAPKRGMVIDARELASRRAAAKATERRETDAAIRSLVAGSPHLKDVAEDAVLAGDDLEVARAKILAEKAKRQKPGGTPEPQDEDVTRANTQGEELTEESVLRALTNLRS